MFDKESQVDLSDGVGDMGGVRWARVLHSRRGFGSASFLTLTDYKLGVVMGFPLGVSVFPFNTTHGEVNITSVSTGE